MNTPTSPPPTSEGVLHQDKYDQMMRLADLFDSSGDEMRERAKLGAEVLADEGVSESADLVPTTYARAEDDIRRGHHRQERPAGPLRRARRRRADHPGDGADLPLDRRPQVAAYRTLGSIAARAVGYLAPEVALGGAIFSAGLIETEALDREGLAAYLNELADANPELMDHFVSGGGGLLDGLQMRALLTAAVLGGSDGAAATRGGLRAVGAPEFAADFSAGAARRRGRLRDPRAGGPDGRQRRRGAPRSIEELMTSLSQVEGELLVQRLGGGRFIGYLPEPRDPARHPAPGRRRQPRPAWPRWWRRSRPRSATSRAPGCCWSVTPRAG